MCLDSGAERIDCLGNIPAVKRKVAELVDAQV